MLVGLFVLSCRSQAHSTPLVKRRGEKLFASKIERIARSLQFDKSLRSPGPNHFNFESPAMQAHAAAVREISAAVQAFVKQGQKFRIFHGSSNTTRAAHGAPVVDISRLDGVLSVDKAAGLALVEPNVPMDTLVRATLARGLIPPVVMEFPGITVGGGFAGTAGESSSFRHGYFDQTVNSVEMVLANGEVVTASASGENRSLFASAAGSLGTLGIVTLLSLRVIPAKPFVKLTYTPCKSIAETIASIRNRATEPTTTAPDFIDGILFSPGHGVVMTGRLVDVIPPDHLEPVRRFSRPWDNWFYLHAQSRSANTTSVEYIPIADYLFRYDRGAFWMGRHAFDYFSVPSPISSTASPSGDPSPLLSVPFNQFTRYSLDDFMHARTLFRALHSMPSASSRYIVQDLAFPYDGAQRFISDFSGPCLSVWPLWLCPLRATDPGTDPCFHPYKLTGAGAEGDGGVHAGAERSEPQPMLNLGLWGKMPRSLGQGDANDRDGGMSAEVWARRVNREIEARLIALGGRKVLYATAHFTEEEFWSVYAAERAPYEAARRRWGADSNLPSVWDKVGGRLLGTVGAGDGSFDGVKNDREEGKEGGKREQQWTRWLEKTWPFDGIMAVARVIKAGEWKIHRDKAWMVGQPSRVDGQDGDAM